MGRTFLDIDMARAADLLGMERRQAEMFRDLQRGRFIALGPALSRRPIPVTIGAVETSARSTSPKLMPLPEVGDDTHDLVFSFTPEEIKTPPRPMPRPQPVPAADLMAQLARPQPDLTPAPRERMPDTTTPEERAAMTSQVLAEVLGDPNAAFKSTAVLYQDFLVRCRIRRLRGEQMSLPDFRRHIAVAKAGVDGELAETEGWKAALELSLSLTDDLQGVFLMLARAAVANEPCPSDAAIARVYGTHSLGRARRLITYFEERDLIVSRMEGKHGRILAFPDLDCETAPGDPDAPEAVAAE